MLILDSTATVVEEVTYDAFGRARHHQAKDLDGDGDFDATDRGIITTISGSPNNLIGLSGYRSEADLDRDGDVDLTDLSLCGTNYQSAIASGYLSDRWNNSGTDNTHGWSGYTLDRETRLYHVRFRYYDTALLRWINRDPAGYADSMNLYGYGVKHAIFEVDPFGLEGNYGFASGVTLDGGWIGFDPSQFGSRSLEWWLERVDEETRRAAEEAYWEGFKEGFIEALTDPWMLLDIALIVLPGAGKLIKWIIKGGVKVYQAYRGARAAGACRLILWCFVAGTEVWTAEGAVPIAQVKAGDQVWSYDHEADEWRLCEVVRLLISDYTGEFATVGYRTGDGEYETIDCTAGHAFWVSEGLALADRPDVAELPGSASVMASGTETRGGRWVEAKWLRVGDHFVTRSGKLATVVGLIIRTERVRVYNLEVEDLHNYAVGADGVVVHNRCDRLARELGNADEMRRLRFHPHHVVPAGHPRARQARDLLRYFGVNIDEAANGLWMWYRYHHRIHTHRYIDYVTDQLGGASSRDRVIEILEEIIQQLKHGTCPF